tara:strand:+ start:388 stop:867 length:480 start_codon:yes stop_codon:yes gene_type:complete
MAITKFTDVTDTGYDVAINRDTTNQTERDKFLAGLVTKIDELTDLINSHITDMATNNAKIGITTAQANAITANTAKTSMVIGSKATQAMAGSTALLALGTSGTTALAGDTNIVTIGSRTTIAFGDMITVPAKGKTPASYSIVMTVTNGGVSKSTTLTLR